VGPPEPQSTDQRSDDTAGIAESTLATDHHGVSVGPLVQHVGEVLGGAHPQFGDRPVSGGPRTCRGLAR